MPQKTLTCAAAEHVAWLRDEPVAPDVLEAVRLCIIDFLGCCVRARSMPWSGALGSYSSRNQGTPEAFHIGLGRHVSADTAAFGNAVIGHSLIREDMHVKSGSHIGVLVIPAMLALAERDRLSGRSLIVGIITGYEMAATLGNAIWASGGHNRHLRPSGMTGSFGVAAGAAASSGLDVDMIVDALGFASNFACGLNQWAWTGSQEIFVHAGMAAQSGLQAHDLARAGLAASADILEGRDGLFAAVGCGEQASALFAAGLRRDTPLAMLGVRHKPVAGCNFVQSPVAAALLAKDQMPGGSAQIDRVVLHSFEEARRYPGCDYAGPFTSIQQAKMSLQYAVCAALVHERLDEEAYADFHNVELLRLLPRMEIRIDDAFNAAFPERQSARVELHMRDGSVITKELADVPWLGDAAVVARFRRELSQAGASTVSSQLLDALATLEDSANCAELFAAISKLSEGRVLS